MTRRWWLGALVAVALGLGAGAGLKWAWLAWIEPAPLAAVVDIAWSGLVPLGAAQRRAAGPGRRPAAVHASPIDGDPAWMSEPAGPGALEAPLVDDLDGQVVRISGYAVPIDTAARRVNEFLLVPYVGACIHVPPPPANQIVHVTSATGLVLRELFDPVVVVGRISARPAATALAAAGYRIEASEVRAAAP